MRDPAATSRPTEVLTVVLGCSQVEPLVKELLLLREQFGFETAGHGLAVFSRSGADETPAGSFDSRRVTGRPEGQENPALWGYGGAFDRAKVPARLAAFVDRIERCGSFSLGRRRHQAAAAPPPTLVHFL